MAGILDIPEVRQRVSRLSVAEYHRLDKFNENGRRTGAIATRFFRLEGRAFDAGGFRT